MSFEAALQTVLDCACSALGAAGWEGECCLNPGQPSLEMCCEGRAMAWGNLVRAYPSPRFPDEGPLQTASGGACAGFTQWALEAEFGASECVCDDLCDCARKGENATRVLEHAEALLAGLLCCFGGSGPCSELEVAVGQLEIGGPEGNCSAFKVAVTIQYDMSCACPPDDES